MPQLINPFHICVTAIRRHEEEKNLWHLVNNIPTYSEMKSGRSTGNIN